MAQSFSKPSFSWLESAPIPTLLLSDYGNFKALNTCIVLIFVKYYNW